MKKLLKLSFLITLLSFVSCSNNKTAEDNKTENKVVSKPTENIEIKKEEYKIDSVEFAKHYTKAIKPPSFDLNVSLENKNVSEIRMFKNEIYARHGYFFTEASIRSYFQKYDWYQPIFWDDNFHISLSDEELAFIDKLNEAEAKTESSKYTSVNGLKMPTIHSALNYNQFENIPKPIYDAVNKNGFVLVPSQNKQLFHIYQQNQKENFPHFITTDLFLQVMQVYAQKMQSEVEDKKYSASLISILKVLQGESEKLVYENGGNDFLKNAATLNTVLYAVPLYFLTGEKQPVPTAWNNFYQEEITKITNALKPEPSLMLDEALFDYSEFKPTGYYALTPKLQNYFKAITWLGEVPLALNKEDQIGAAMLTAFMLNNLKDASGNSLSTLYKSMYEPYSTLIGGADQLSLVDFMDYMSKFGTALNYKSFITSSAAQDCKANFQKYKGRTKVNFLAKKSSLDAEIFQYLTDPKARTLPKAMDIFAVLNNETAISISKSSVSWGSYPTKLNEMKQKADSYTNWHKTMYGKWVKNLNYISTKPTNPPSFMATEAWSKRCLYTSLASYTTLNGVLNISQPLVRTAPCNINSNLPSAILPCYVEPNLAFWSNCLGVIDLLSQSFAKHNLMDNTMINNTNAVKELAQFFYNVSQKELKQEPLSDDEHKRLASIGSFVENLTITQGNNAVDNSISTLINLFSFKNQFLQEAVGNPHEIYALVEINGNLYLTRGAVFSYYEMVQNFSTKINEAQWRGNPKTNHPDWMNGVVVNSSPILVSPKFKAKCN